MNRVINLNYQKMIFEKQSLHVVVPLDPTEGACYTEPVRDDNIDIELDCIYQITTRDQDRVNLIEDGPISWERDSSCTSDSDEEIKRWQNRLHEVTTLNCNQMTRMLRRVVSEVKELLAAEGTTRMEEPEGTVMPTQNEHDAHPGLQHKTIVPGWQPHQKTRPTGRGYRRRTRVIQNDTSSASCSSCG